MKPEPITRSTKLDALPQYLRVEEYAALLDCSKGVVYDMVRRGVLPHVRLGRLVRIPRTVFENGNSHHG